MNAAGDIVINTQPQGDPGSEGGITLLWKASSTTAVRLPQPKAADIYDITGDGTIVGGIY